MAEEIVLLELAEPDREGPYRPLKYRTKVERDAVRQAVMRAILEGYRNTGTIVGGCKEAGVSRQLHDLWMAKRPEYKEAFEAVKQEYVDSLLAEATRRARDGVEKGVWFQGVRVGKERQYSDNLLMFLIKGKMPEYRDHNVISGPDGGPVQIQAVRQEALARLPAEALEALRLLNQRAALPEPEAEEDGDVEVSEVPMDGAGEEPEADEGM